jgi:hypothetical protein
MILEDYVNSVKNFEAFFNVFCVAKGYKTIGIGSL